MERDNGSGTASLHTPRQKSVRDEKLGGEKKTSVF